MICRTVPKNSLGATPYLGHVNPSSLRYIRQVVTSQLVLLRVRSATSVLIIISHACEDDDNVYYPLAARGQVFKGLRSYEVFQCQIQGR